jgi:hypothetical protein
MAKQETKNINGIEVTLQSVSPEWYFDNFDRFGRGKNTKRYVDELIKNVVVQPAEIRQKGVEYFNEFEDIGGASLLVEEIENFLGRGNKQGGGKKTSNPTS